MYTEYACPPASSAAKNQQTRYNLNSSLILQRNGSTFLGIKNLMRTTPLFETSLKEMCLVVSLAAT
jgi:hypothetical protein